MRTIRPLIAMIVLTLALGACGGAASQANLSTVGSAVGESQYSTSDGGVRAGASAAPAAAPGEDGVVDANAIGARDDARIIRTGSIQVEVSDVQRALRAARDAIVALGGYVGASNTSNADDQPSAQITYRVPADRWEDALDVLHSLGGLTTKVLNEQTQAVEVTGQIVDLEARIRNLRASETALQGIAANATKVSDVLEVEARLTDIRGQIEQLTAQLKDLGDRASYATLTADFSSPIVAVTAASKGWEPAGTVDQAAASLISILQAVASVGIWFLIVWLPILLILGLIAGVGIRLVRRTGLGRRPDGSGLLPPPPPPPVEALAGEG